MTSFMGPLCLSTGTNVGICPDPESVGEYREGMLESVSRPKSGSNKTFQLQTSVGTPARTRDTVMNNHERTQRDPRRHNHPPRARSCDAAREEAARCASFFFFLLFLLVFISHYLPAC